MALRIQFKPGRLRRGNKALAHSTTADFSGVGIDQARETEQSRDTKGAGDEEGGQHDRIRPPM